MTEITPERLAQIKANAPKIIYNAMRFDRSENAPVWLDGNSGAEEAARRTVVFLGIPDLIAALEAAQAENAKLRADMAKVYELALEAAKEISGIKAELGRRIKP